MPTYIPKQGDFVILNFDPRSGHEQMKFVAKAESALLDEILAVLDACIHPPDKA